MNQTSSRRWKMSYLVASWNNCLLDLDGVIYLGRVADLDRSQIDMLMLWLGDKNWS